MKPDDRQLPGWVEGANKQNRHYWKSKPESVKHRKYTTDIGVMATPITDENFFNVYFELTAQEKLPPHVLRFLSDHEDVPWTLQEK